MLKINDFSSNINKLEIDINTNEKLSISEEILKKTKLLKINSGKLTSN